MFGFQEVKITYNIIGIFNAAGDVHFLRCQKTNQKRQP